MSGQEVGLALSVFAACAVEAVEALTIVLAVGVTRSWRSSLTGVGVMLTSFGMFWGAEGAGAHWPGSDAALLGLIPGTLVFALGLVALLKRRAPVPVGEPASPARETEAIGA
jgi:uncharacterized membrane protein